MFNMIRFSLSTPQHPMTIITMMQQPTTIKTMAMLWWPASSTKRTTTPQANNAAPAICKKYGSFIYWSMKNQQAFERNSMLYDTCLHFINVKKTIQFKIQCKGCSHRSRTANTILPGFVIKQRWTHLHAVFENTYFMFFSDFKKTWLFTFFWNDVSKSRKKSLAKV